MINPPKTVEEAKARRYTKWAGNPKGNSYREERCAYEHWSNHLGQQCSRPKGHGLNGLYCKQHAKIVGER